MMKKIPFALIVSLSATVTAFAEDMSEELAYIPVNNTIVLIAAVILLVGVVGISAFNGYAYNKKNLRKMLSQYAKQSRMKNGVHSNAKRYNPDNNSYQHDQMMQQQMNDEINRQFMEESMKSVTPFDHGGYVQGPGFSPSDTAAQQMNDMNNMNMGMF